MDKGEAHSHYPMQLSMLTRYSYRSIFIDAKVNAYCQLTGSTSKFEVLVIDFPRLFTFAFAKGETRNKQMKVPLMRIGHDKIAVNTTVT
jgi:hypothetical protein